MGAPWSSNYASQFGNNRKILTDSSYYSYYLCSFILFFLFFLQRVKQVGKLSTKNKKKQIPKRNPPPKKKIRHKNYNLKIQSGLNKPAKATTTTKNLSYYNFKYFLRSISYKWVRFVAPLHILQFLVGGGVFK